MASVKKDRLLRDNVVVEVFERLDKLAKDVYSTSFESTLNDFVENYLKHNICNLTSVAAEIINEEFSLFNQTETAELRKEVERLEDILDDVRSLVE